MRRDVQASNFLFAKPLHTAANAPLMNGWPLNHSQLASDSARPSSMGTANNVSPAGLDVSNSPPRNESNAQLADSRTKQHLQSKPEVNTVTSEDSNTQIADGLAPPSRAQHVVAPAVAVAPLLLQPPAGRQAASSLAQGLRSHVCMINSSLQGHAPQLCLQLPAA